MAREEMKNKNLQFQEEENEFEERVVHINRVAKVVKGGRRFNFSAIAVIGDRKGNVGFGHGKAQEIPDAIKKAVSAAKANLVHIPIVKTTIPHEVTGKSGSGVVFFKPASEGTGIVAGGAVRTIFELAGVNDVLAKSIGSATPINVVRATFAGLKELRTLKEVAKLRGKKIGEIV